RALARQCCYVPLALRIAAELAATRPGVSLAALVDELSDVHRRLDLMDSDVDPRSAMRAVFSWSYRALTPDVAAAFRLVGLHPGVTVSASTLAALTGSSPLEAGRWLDQLATASLLQSVGSDHYSAHDLLRAFARELAETVDPPTERVRALEGLFA